MHLKKLAAALVVAGTIAPAAFATDGYFQPGYSVKSVGMGGVGIALAQDSLAAAANPAGMALVGDRVDGGLTYFQPKRSANINGVNYDGNSTSYFLIPEVGYNHMINPDMSVGVSLYGNGGMNSGYDTIASSHTGLLDGAGVDLQQMFISPSFAWKVTPTQTIGVAVNLVHESFRANGLSQFAAYSSNSKALTDNGHDSGNGIGVRLGWIGQITPELSLGVTYQPKTHISKIAAYSGLFADQGSMDIPANFGVGASWTNKTWTVAADIERIQYSDIPAVGDTSTTMAPGSLGTTNGPGFGWSDVTVEKIGVAYAMNEQLTLRAGYNHTDNPVSGVDVFFNTISPGVITDHLTLGATYAIDKHLEISGDYVHAFKSSVTGPLKAPPYGPGGSETLTMYQDSLGIAIGYKF